MLTLLRVLLWLFLWLLLLPGPRLGVLDLISGRLLVGVRWGLVGYHWEHRAPQETVRRPIWQVG